MRRENWNNGGCCMDEGEMKKLGREWKRFMKLHEKMVKKLTKLRHATTDEDMAHILWDIRWMMDDTISYVEDEYEETFDEYNKIDLAHKKHVAKLNRGLGYHLDRLGRWVRK